ncbi:MAG: hypothetical protein M3O71_21565 [Bacteroidota bacterium]|nr:hypothetical protein [Bacteroidota bacterium]
MNKNKVPAYTIMEVTITMLVSAILIAITYTSYSIVTKSYNSFTGKNTDLAVLVSLDHLFTRDFEKANAIVKDSTGILLQRDSNSIRYEFAPDFIIRRAARIDTFKVQNQEVTTSFENIPLPGLRSDSVQNIIDELDFTILYQKEKITYHYHKSYSSENLIERNPNAVH